MTTAEKGTGLYNIDQKYLCVCLYDLFQLACICEIVGDQLLFWYLQLLLSLLSECNDSSCQVDQPTPLDDDTKM